jgi:ammonia channel protein AmtB
VFVCYQLTFAIITVALICGSIVERINFGALFIFVILWSILVYAPVGHMVWGGGYLSKMGVLDFAGGTVVHINSGIAGLVGLISGVLCFLACTKLKSALGYDDALDVFGIHAFGGAVGAVLTGVFATKAIGGVEGGFDQVKLQLLGVGVTVLYTTVVTFIILKVVNLITPLRASDAQERDGLDLSQHGEQIS